MTTVVRTLPGKDALILARSVVARTSSKGYVEAHGLRWRSDALRGWELSEIKLGRTPTVDVRIDELDLSVVFVELPDADKTVIRAISTQPQYTSRLSLFEHQKLKATLKEKAEHSRLSRMDDREAYRLRVEYYAALGRANDPISRRQLEKLRDQLASRRLDQSMPDDTDPTDIQNLENDEAEAPVILASDKKSRRSHSRGHADEKTTLPEMPIQESTAPQPSGELPSEVRATTNGFKVKPTFQSISTKRIPR